jgi:nucleotide-binding universal stress UspA family protein
MATRGRSGIGRWVYGSTTDKVPYGTALPMLVVRPQEGGPSTDVTFRRLVLPLDGSELSESVIPHAEILARQMSLEVEVVRVVPTATMAYSSGFDTTFFDPKVFDYISDNANDYAEQKAVELREMSLNTTSTVLQGDAPTRIIERADAAAGTLIVMSTHGRTGAGRWVLGSVADRVLRASHTPVLLVRSPE